MCKSYLDENNRHENGVHSKEHSRDEHEYGRDHVCAEKNNCGDPTTEERKKYIDQELT